MSTRKSKPRHGMKLIHSVDTPDVHTPSIDSLVKAIKAAAAKRQADADAAALLRTERDAALEIARVKFLVVLRDELPVELLPEEKRLLAEAVLRDCTPKELGLLPEELGLAVKRQPYLAGETVPGRTRRRTIRA